MTHLVVVAGPSAVTARDLFTGVQWCDRLTLVVEPGRYGDAMRGLLPDARFLGTHELDDLGPVDGVVTFTEALLPLAAELGRRSGAPAHSAETVVALRDKSIQRQRLAAAGLDHVVSRRLESASDWRAAVRAVGLPLVLKPVRGQGSAHTRLAATASDVELLTREWFARSGADPLVAETLLVGASHEPYGDYVSVESVCVDGQVQHLGVTGKLPMLPPFRETGQFHPSGLPPALEEECLAVAGQALRALGVRTGASHVELKLTEHGPRLIEVNGRLGGYLNELYSRVLGVDVVEHVTRHACSQGRELPDARQPGVHFQYTHQPPAGARALTALEGARTVARDPAVRGYQRLVALGERLPADGRTTDLDLLAGHVGEHADLLGELGRLRSELEFTFEFDEGTRRLRGDQLG